MKLAIYQSPVTDGDTASALARIRTMLDAAALAGAAMLVVPELILPGYNRPDLHRDLAQTRDGPWLRDIGDMARNSGCGLTFGWAERDGEAVYNSATAIGVDGHVLGHYRKLQLYGPMEAESFASGNLGYTVFELEGRKAGLLVCYDVEFADHVAALHDIGVDLILVPTANPAGFEHVQRALIPARAHEARAVIAYANYCGTEAGLEFGGLSLIAGPDAEVLAQAGLGETLIVTDLDAVDRIPADRLSTHRRDFRPV